MTRTSTPPRSTRRGLRTRLEGLSRRTLLLGMISATVGGAVGVLAAVSTNGVPVTPDYAFSVVLPADGPPLKVADPVRVAGKNAGQVLELRPLADGLQVKVSLDRRYAPIGTDARVSVRAQVGTSLAYVALEPGEAERRIADGGVLSPGQVTVTPSLPQALEAFDASTREATGRVLRVGGDGLRGRGAQVNTTIRRGRTAARDVAPLIGATASRQDALRAAVRDAPVVAGALSGRKADDLSALIAAADAVSARLSARTGDIRASVRRTVEIQRQLPAVFDRFDASARDTSVLLDQAATAIDAIDTQVPDLLAILNAVPTLRSALERVASSAKPALDILQGSLADLAYPAQGAQPVLESLAALGRSLGPREPDLRRLAKGLDSATSGKLGKLPVVRVSPSLGCHTARNPRPAPGQVAEERAPC